MILPVKTRYDFIMIEEDFTGGTRESLHDNPVSRCLVRSGVAMTVYADKFAHRIFWHKGMDYFEATMPMELVQALLSYDVDSSITLGKYRIEAQCDLYIAENKEI